MRNDVKEWLPSHFPETAVHRWFQSHFPYEQFVLCSWEGCTLDDQRLELLAKKLVPKKWPEEEGSADKAPAVAPLTKDALPEKDPCYFKDVLTGPRLIGELADRYPSLSDDEILSRLEGSLIGADHNKTCLVVTLTSEAKGKHLRKAVEKIRSLAQECNIEPPEVGTDRGILLQGWDQVILAVRETVVGRDPPTKGIRMGGPPIDNVAIDVEGERTLFRLAGLSALVGLGISMACFRSWRLTSMVFWTAILAAGVGLAWVFWSGSSVDAIMLSMPSLVYVLAISGAIHMINYYHDAIREHGLDQAPGWALKHAWFPCTMAAITTAIGLGSLYGSQVIPISKFGVYSACGVVATLALLFLMLPALLSYFPSRKFAEEHGGKGEVHHQADTPILRTWRHMGRFVIRHNVAVSLACLVAMGFLAFGLPQIRTSVKLMKLFSHDAEIIHHYAWLEDHLGPLVPMEVVLKIDNQKCDLSVVERMRLAEKVEHTIEENLDAVGGALSAATLAPDVSPWSGRDGFLGRMGARAKRITRENTLCRQIERHRADLRDYLTIEAQADLAQLGIEGKLAERLEQRDLSSLSAIESFGDPEQSIAANLESVREIDQAEATAVVEAIAAWRKERGTELWRISARVDALSDLDYAVFVDDLKRVVEPVLHEKREELGFDDDEGIVAVYTGLVPLVYQTQHALMSGLNRSLAMAFVLIAFVMMFVLKSPVAGLLSMIPNVFPVVIIFGIMGWMGILVDIGSMMTASVALGVAVDDTMHYLAWFRAGLDQGLDRKGAAMLAYDRCATAMTQTTLIGGLGLAAFAFSTFTPTQRFGVLMLVLLSTALLGDLIFLPALLTGPLGRCFGRRRKLKNKVGSQLPGELTSSEPAGLKEGVWNDDQEAGVVGPRHEQGEYSRSLRPDRGHRSHRAPKEPPA